MLLWRWSSLFFTIRFETNQLGTPQGVYRLKSGAICFQCIIGLLIFSVGIVTLAFSIYLALTSGTDLWPATITAQFYRFLDMVDFPPLHIHDLRHSASTLLRSTGVDLKVIQ